MGFVPENSRGNGDMYRCLALNNRICGGSVPENSRAYDNIYWCLAVNNRLCRGFVPENSCGNCKIDWGFAGMPGFQIHSSFDHHYDIVHPGMVAFQGFSQLLLFCR